METLTVAEMKAVDRRTIDDHVPGPELMERAGTAVFRWLEREFFPAEETRVHVLCGKGNNGGDGFVVGRRLMEAGSRVTFYLVPAVEEIEGDAEVAFGKLSDPEIVRLDEEGRARLLDTVRDGDWIVDGLLGTGIASEVREPFASVIDLVNELRRGRDVLVFAIDIPSGVQGDSGEILGRAIRADATVTIARPKLGLLFHPGRVQTGRLVVATAGFPDDVVREEAGGREVLVPEELARLLPERPPDTYKYRCGSLLVVSGSRRFTGAPLLVARGALRAGSGMVYLAAPDVLDRRLAGLTPETIYRGCESTDEGTLAAGALEEIRAWIDRADALAVGPGIDRHPETLDLAGRLVEESGLPAVIDADALALFEPEGRRKFRNPERLVVTPHAGEMARMTGETAPGAPGERIDWARRWAETWGVTVVLKGGPTLVADPGGTVTVNGSGTNALASGGTGDVLTGILGSLLAQGCPPGEAARLAVYVHGRTGELAASSGSARSVVAGDLPEYMGEAYRELEKGEEVLDCPPWVTAFHVHS
jgi:hydroxyethylthiazole kinase-like uncharacterized protein yjeF